MCGATSEQKTAQANEASLAASETSFYNSMTSDFAKIFSQNENILGSLTTAFEPILAAGPNQQGFSKPELTAMQTQASDLTTQGANNAQIAAAAKNATTGGSDIPSGAQEQINAMINQSAASAGATAQENITQANYATGRANFDQAATALDQGVAATEGASSGFAGATSGAGNAAATGDSTSMEGANAIQAANDAWMGPVFGMIGSIGGAALGKKCWIAAAVYDEDFETGPRVNAVRRWLVNDYEKTFVGKYVMAAYGIFGKFVAALVTKSPSLKKQLKKLFDIALSKSEEKYGPTHG